MTASYLRNYLWKRQQYEWWQIPEYWIIDPRRKKITVLTLIDHVYQDVIYAGQEKIASITLPNIALNQLITGQLED